MRVRGEALGPCWPPGLLTVVIFREPLLLLIVVVVVLTGLLVAVTCTGGISILLVRQDCPCRPEDEGPRP